MVIGGHKKAIKLCDKSSKILTLPRQHRVVHRRNWKNFKLFLFCFYVGFIMHAHKVRLSACENLQLSKDVPRNMKNCKVINGGFLYYFHWKLNVMRLSFTAARNLYVFAIFSSFFHETYRCYLLCFLFSFCNLVISFEQKKVFDNYRKNCG